MQQLETLITADRTATTVLSARCIGHLGEVQIQVNSIV